MLPASPAPTIVLLFCFKKLARTVNDHAYVCSPCLFRDIQLKMNSWKISALTPDQEKHVKGKKKLILQLTSKKKKKKRTNAYQAGPHGVGFRSLMCPSH